MLLFLLFVLLIGGFFGYQKYQDIFSPNVSDSLSDPYLFIPTGSSYADVTNLLIDNKIVKDTASFNWVARQMNYTKKKVRPGRYKIVPGWSNRALVSHLRAGRQAPVKIVLTNERLVTEIAAKAAATIEADSASIARILTSEEQLNDFGYTPQTILSAFIPNTYEFYWNTSAKGFVEKMIEEKEKFWKKNKRTEKAKALNLSPLEVYTLASIVERETNQTDEKDRIAGVYYNRIEKGMLLQADPTVVFAVGDFGLRRVLNKHLEIDSPYNTYKYTGLPPGPISLAHIPTLDAVLNMEDHDYYYFCSKGDGSGYHAFAKTLSQHNANARRYYRTLRERGLR